VKSYNRKILLYSKNKTTLSFALNYMGKQGYQVDGADDYILALKKIHQTDIALVVFLDETEKKDQDYIENIGKSLKTSLQFLHLNDSIQHLPGHLEHLRGPGE